MNQFLAKLRKGKVERIGFKAQAQGGELELQVYDVIGADFFGEGITVGNFSDAMKEAGEYSSIKLRINSPGGDVFEAVAIYNLLRNAGKPVTCVVEGVAASAASVIAMAGDKCVMGEGSVMMIHNAMMMAFGNAADLRKCADTLDTVSSSIADIYTSNTGLAKGDIQKMMDAETWMDAEECVEKGFADAVAGDKVQARAASVFDLAVYNNVPEKLKAEPEVKAEDPVAAPVHIELMRKRLELLRRA
jgi:ATP-dependent Clp protease protease subunit